MSFNFNCAARCVAETAAEFCTTPHGATSMRHGAQVRQICFVPNTKGPGCTLSSYLIGVAPCTVVRCSKTAYAFRILVVIPEKPNFPTAGAYSCPNSHVTNRPKLATSDRPVRFFFKGSCQKTQARRAPPLPSGSSLHLAILLLVLLQ